MGVGVRSSNYRLRTIWTPEMDRYFIDLMLEQVAKENRKDDNLFSKRAWRHMTLMFNAKFNSKYEKEVLKNRYKMLRNLYRALKNLLEQKGFRWDESRQMVTADDRVWDDYIQAHPIARPYRVKTVPYYSDLCEIYGNSGFGGKSTFSGQKGNISQAEEEKVVDDEKLWSNVLEYSTNLGSKMATESLHDIMIDEDYEISTAKGLEFMSDIGATIGGRTRTYWQPPMDRYFIDLMLDQVSQGNHVDGLLRKQAWREMISSFNARFGFNYTVDILKNRYKTLRKQHNAIKSLLELDGFAWDDAKEMVVADDCVWQSYMKAHTDARQYMTRPIPYFKDLCSIFRELNGDEKDTISSHQNLGTLNQSPAASVSTYDQSYKENESSHSDYNVAAINQTTKRQVETPLTTESSKKSRSDNEGLVHDNREMTSAASSLVGKNKEGENLNVIPVELVVAAIQALPDMDEDLVLDACDFLEDENKAKTFLALDVKLRKKWLLRKLRPSQTV
ncbi:hypothetical protein CDL12_03116 [Handroanthus impetiginosus]|uniref:Myb/SANT-like domain-containing protein n=1 Tax=Handroanthus impetiginosus TaxID=429701 RepID=A0A2G9I330_9LAMI|nr:hypothetical protein CDL12_03116 [Handroanthus impetiginosus]